MFPITVAPEKLPQTLFERVAVSYASWVEARPEWASVPLVRVICVIIPEYSGEEMLEPVGAEVSTLTTTVEDSEQIGIVVVTVVEVVEEVVVVVTVVEVVEEVVVVEQGLHRPEAHKSPQGRL